MIDPELHKHVNLDLEDLLVRILRKITQWEKQNNGTCKILCSDKVGGKLEIAAKMGYLEINQTKI